jgi:hypothetical protein
MTAYTDSICTRRGRAIIAPSGNEANARHHYSGEISGGYDEVEINVEEDMAGFTMELWSGSVALASAAVISPSGEELPKVPLRTGTSGEYKFLLEKTVVSIDYRIEAKETAAQLIFMRFSDAKRGIWKLLVYPESDFFGKYDIWLPVSDFLEKPVYFLRPDPDVTVTSPGYIPGVITAGGYKSKNNSIYSESGRGYGVSGNIKPDFAAPSVDIEGPGLRGNFVTMTGTSAAAAVTAGAAAQLMQWAIVEKNAPALSGEGMKAMLCRGAARQPGRTYPNREWGYGALDVYEAFIRGTI